MISYIWNIKFSRVKTENGRIYCDSGDAEIYAKSEEEVKEIFYEEMSSEWVLDEIVKGERIDFEED